MSAPASDLWTMTEAADYLRVHPRTLKRYMDRENFPAIPMGGTYRFRKADIDIWLDGKLQQGVRKKALGGKRGRKPGTTPQIIKRRPEMLP